MKLLIRRIVMIMWVICISPFLLVLSPIGVVCWAFNGETSAIEEIADTFFVRWPR